MNIGVCYLQNNGNSISMSESVCDVLRRMGHTVTEAVMEKRQWPTPEWNDLDFILILEAEHYNRPQKWRRFQVPKVLWYTETAKRPDIRFELVYEQHRRMTPLRFFVAKQDAEAYGSIWLPHGVDTVFYRPLGIPKLYDIGYFGNIYGRRAKMWEMIQQADIKVEVFPRTPGERRESFTGLVKLINQCNVILALPAYSHSFTTRPTETMACGVPIVVPRLAKFARCNELQWFCQSPYYYEENDIESLKDAIARAQECSPFLLRQEAVQCQSLEIRLQRIIDAVKACPSSEWRNELCVEPDSEVPDIAIIRAYQRPEFLHYALKHLQAADTLGIQVEAWIDCHDGVPADDRVVKMIAPLYPHCVVEEHDYQGDTHVFMEALRNVVEQGADRIHFIEEDVMIAPDFFRWHQAAQRMGYGVTVASYHHTHTGVADDADPEEVFESDIPCAVGLCLSRQYAELLLKHATPEYYDSREMMRAYIQRKFPDSKLDGSWAWDGLLHRIMEQRGERALYPLKPRCFHCGWYGQNRQTPGTLSGLGLQMKIERIGRIIYSNEELQKASGNLVANRVFDLTEKPWQELKLRTT